MAGLEEAEETTPHTLGQTPGGGRMGDGFGDGIAGHSGGARRTTSLVVRMESKSVAVRGESGEVLLPDGKKTQHSLRP